MDDSHTSGEWAYPEQEDGQIQTSKSSGVVADEEVVFQIVRVWGGTALAGGIFGVLLFFWELVLPTPQPTLLASPEPIITGVAQVIAGSLAGFLVGAIWAGSVGLAVILVIVSVAHIIGVEHPPRWIASCIGATTAFLCCGSFHWVPILLGQLGASLACRRTAGNEPQDEREVKGESSRYSLKQLFRVMTVLCVGLGIFSLLPIEEGFRLQIGYCIAWQIVTVAAWILAKKALGSNEPTALSQR